MYLEKISLVNFRNYRESTVTFNSCLNIIYGSNAQGKTNLLEAIYLLCLGRSFRQANNEDLLNTGADYFTLDGDLKLDNGISKRVVVQYKKDGKKEISIDRKRIKSHATIFGNFPTIVMSPDDYKITTGGPSERRRFIDILLSQFSLTYLNNLQDYHRILRQRNSILQSQREGGSVSDAAIEPWSEKLVQVGSQIVQSRYAFVQQFLPTVDSIYKNYTQSKDSFGMCIESTTNDNGEQPKEENFFSALLSCRSRERAMGTTLVGPHRDDIIFEIDGKNLRKYGSRGEHKSVLISLKLAEFRFLKEKRVETPVFLLDDFRSELDKFREEKVFSSLQGLGQIFLTTPIKKMLSDDFLGAASFFDVSKFHVAEGQIELYN